MFFTEKPAISIIVTVYNDAKHLEGCIESILAQTFTRFEVIIVDDGSTDNSLKICKDYELQDRRIRVYHQKHQGAIVARNFAITIAKGEYIFPMYGDDKLNESALFKMYEAIQNQAADVVYSNTETFDNSNDIIEMSLPDRNNPSGCDISVCSALYKKGDWKNYQGYDPNVDSDLNHWEFWLNFIEDSKKIVKLDDALVYYREKTTNVSPEDKKRVFEYSKNKHKKLYNAPFGMLLDSVKKLFKL